MKNLILFLLAAIPAVAISAGSQTWGGAAAWTYTPSNKKGADGQSSYFTVWEYDSESEKPHYKGDFLYDENNTLDKSSFDTVLAEFEKLGAAQLLYTAAKLGEQIAAVNTELARMDESLADLSQKLNTAFGDIFKKFREIQVNKSSASGSGTVTETYEIKNKTENKFYLSGGVAAAKVDDRSIEIVGKGENEKYQIFGLPLVGADAGKIPTFGFDLKIQWKNPLDWFKNSASVEAASANLRTIDNGGINLKCWKTPTGDTVKCDETLASQLTSGSNTHYIVTQLKDGGKLHYTPVGVLSNLTGNASIRFVGTSGSAGPADAKTTVKFESARDSNVSVVVSDNDDPSGTNITITIGVKWK